MTAWPMWLLIVGLVIAAFLLIGGGRITTGPRMHHRSDRYDPVYLRHQEILEANEASARNQTGIKK